MAPRAPQPRPDLTAAVLLLAWDRILADDLRSDTEPFRTRIAVSAAKSELIRLGLIDEMGSPTKEGRRMLGLI